MTGIRLGWLQDIVGPKKRLGLYSMCKEKTLEGFKQEKSESNPYFKKINRAAVWAWLFGERDRMGVRVQ